MAASDEIKGIRDELGMSQDALASLLGYSRRTVHRWETGRSAPRTATMLFLRQCVRESLPLGLRRTGHSRFTFIDLFAGIGGMRLGFERHGGGCVFTCEWDRFSRRTYSANFPSWEQIAGDIRQVRTDEVPKHDLLLAGFPCQPFSIAGVSKKNSLGRPHGFADDTQGTLFFDIARILQSRRPSAFLLENVKHLRNHDRGRTMDVIVRTLTDELGYDVTTRVIDARSFLPQHRERVFIAGFREDTGFDLDGLEIPDPLAGPRLDSVLHPEDGSEDAEPPYTVGPLAAVADKYTLSDHLWSYLRAYARKHRQRGNGFGYSLVGPADTARTLSARYHKDGSEILIRQEGRNPRRLTPRECARLMGFDPPGESRFEIPVSDTQAYRQFGNAVAVPVVQAIADAMADHVAALARDPGQLEMAGLLRTA